MKKRALALFAFCALFILSALPVLASPLINEFSSATSGDWVEIFNPGPDAVDLSLYRLRDLTATNKLDLTGTLSPLGFAAFDWSNKLNNAGDLIKLVLISDESIIDQVTYGDQGGQSAPDSSQTVGRQSDGETNWVIFTSPSKNSSNNSSSTFSPPSPTPSKTPTPTKSPTPTKTSTATKTSSEDIKTPTPKISITNASSETTNSNTTSTKNTNFAKISTYSKFARQLPSIKSLEEKKKGEVKALGANDKAFSFIPILIGGILLIGAGAWFVYKNSEQIKIWKDK